MPFASAASLHFPPGQDLVLRGAQGRTPGAEGTEGTQIWRRDGGHVLDVLVRCPR